MNLNVMGFNKTIKNHNFDLRCTERPYSVPQLCSLALAPLQIRFAVAVAFHRCCWHVDLVTSKFPWKFPPTVLYKIPPPHPTPPHPTPPNA